MSKKRKYKRKAKKQSPEQKVLVGGDKSDSSESALHRNSTLTNTAVVWNTKTVLILFSCIFFTALLFFFAITIGVEKGLTGYAVMGSETVELQKEKYLSSEQMWQVVNTSKENVEEMNAAGFNTYYVTYVHSLIF